MENCVDSSYFCEHCTTQKLQKNGTFFFYTRLRLDSFIFAAFLFAAFVCETWQFVWRQWKSASSQSRVICLMKIFKVPLESQRKRLWLWKLWCETLLTLITQHDCTIVLQQFYLEIVDSILNGADVACCWENKKFINYQHFSTYNWI